MDRLEFGLGAGLVRKDVHLVIWKMHAMHYS
jgi:hypothetical protein